MANDLTITVAGAAGAGKSTIIDIIKSGFDAIGVARSRLRFSGNVDRETSVDVRSRRLAAFGIGDSNIHIVEQTTNRRSPKWTLDTAVTLVRRLQPLAGEAGYYLAIAGGVLNNGQSDHDLDLVAVPLTQADAMPNYDMLQVKLTTAIGGQCRVQSRPTGQLLRFAILDIDVLVTPFA